MSRAREGSPFSNFDVSLIRCRKFSQDSFYYVYDSEQPIPLSASGVSSNASNSLARSAASTVDSNSSLVRRANAIGAAIPIRRDSHLKNDETNPTNIISKFMNSSEPNRYGQNLDERLRVIKSV